MQFNFQRLRDIKDSKTFRRHWLTVAFFGGFVVDNITLNRVDQLFDNFVLASYVVLAGASMLLLYAALAEKLPDRVQPFFVKWAPLALQFSFGGLLSGLLVFYSRSGSWIASWPFLLLILGVIVSNELIKRRAQRLAFNLVVFFIGVFSYLVLVFPVILGKMGAWVFIASAVASLAVVFGCVRILYSIVPRFITVNVRMIIFSLGMTFVTLNFLYFANVIPPIPLSLKDIGIYHNVERIGTNTYRLTYEDGEWYEFFKNSDDTFHYDPGDRVFCYAAVFAPTRLSTTVFHRWEFKDPETGEWTTRSRLAYTIEGGRDGGYRGFTLQDEAVHDGVWRCTIETARGQVLGREVFEITRNGDRGELVTRED